MIFPLSHFYHQYIFGIFHGELITSLDKIQTLKWCKHIRVGYHMKLWKFTVIDIISIKKTSGFTTLYIFKMGSWNHTVFFKTRGHLSRLAWPTQRDGLSCLASPRLALRCAAWPSKTSPDSCSRPVATSGCSHRYYNDNAKCINIAFFSVSEAMFLYKNDCLKWQNIILKK